MLNVARESLDAAPDDGVVRRFAAQFFAREWPGTRRPEVFYDPRGLQPGGSGPRAVQHAKCVVIDDAEALVTSANFTEAAQERNIEAAETGLEDIDRVRGFFGLSQEGPPAEEPSEETTAGDDTRTIRPPEDDTRVIPPAEDDTRVIGGAGEDDTQVLRKPGPLSDSNEYWDTEDDREK